MTRLVDPRNVDSGDWELFEVTPEYRRFRLWISDTQYIVRTEFLADDALIESNKQDFDDSQGKRWGNGQVAARIPLNVLFSTKSELAKRAKEGDREHLKWWLNSESARPYRTFKGRI